MKKITKILALASIGFAAFLSNPAAQAQALGQWDFNSSNLNATADGLVTLGNMTYNDATATAAATTFGTNNIAGTSAIVMGFPAATNGMGYRVPTPAGNGGFAVNQYTYILDVFYPTASSGKIRPLIQTHDGLALGSQQFIVIDANGAVGPLKIGPGGVTGPYVGNILPNTWYRLAISVTAGGTIRVYTNGVAMGSFSGGAVDSFFALEPSNSALILADTSTNAAAGFVNSIQLRDSALSAGQIAALGAASAAGIPLVIPPVPSFISSRTPDVGQTGVSEVPAINVVLDQGSTTVTEATIQLKLDGVVVPAIVTPSLPTFTITYQVPPRLDPLSAHTLSLTYTDSVLGSQTHSWPFTVKDYQVVTLPAPFYFENFDGLTLNPTNGVALPAGWTVTNQTTVQGTTFDLASRTSKSYEDWILVDNAIFNSWGGNRTSIPTIILNGTALTSLTSGKLLWAESDSRTGSAGNNGQYSDLFTAPISCVGKSNVFVAFNSIYMQNQDNMDFMEYSVDGGVNWLPVLYMFDNNFLAVYGPAVTNITATFGVTSPSRNWVPNANGIGTNYGIYIKAPINSSLIPSVVGHVDDGELDGKRIEVIRLAQADGKADVRFRLNANGTSAWFWGIDDFGLYEINTPVFTTHPANLSVAAGTGTNFTVVVSSPTPVTYQWQHAGTNISNSGHYSGVTTPTLTVSNADTNDAGSYRCKALNSSGPATSNPGSLTVVTVPTIVTQPNSVIVSEGYPASLSGRGFGGLPLTYQWYKGASPVGGNSTNYNVASAQIGDAGSYKLVVSNSYGAVTSRVVRISVAVGAITNDLVVHLKLDSNYADSSGHGNNATPVNSPTLVAGKIGNAMQFTTARGVVPAITNYATLGYPADLQFGSTTDFSLSCWVNYTDQDGDPALISNSNWDSGSNPGWGLFTQGGGNIRVKASDINRVTANTGSVGPLIKGTGWHHILAVFQQGGAIFTMVDGVVVSTTAWTPLASVDTTGANWTRNINFPPSTDLAGPHSINIGQDGTGFYNDKDGVSITNGVIDDVGFWRRAVSPQQALAIYSAGQAGKSLDQAALSLGTLSVSVSGGNVNFTWAGGPGIKLQKSSPSVTGTYINIDSTLGLSSYSEAITAAPTFYRLSKP